MLCLLRLQDFSRTRLSTFTRENCPATEDTATVGPYRVEDDEKQENHLVQTTCLNGGDAGTQVRESPHRWHVLSPLLDRHANINYVSLSGLPKYITFRSNSFNSNAFWGFSHWRCQDITFEMQVFRCSILSALSDSARETKWVRNMSNPPVVTPATTNAPNWVVVGEWTPAANDTTTSILSPIHRQNEKPPPLPSFSFSLSGSPPSLCHSLRSE